MFLYEGNLSRLLGRRISLGKTQNRDFWRSAPRNDSSSLFVAAENRGSAASERRSFELT